MKHITSYFCLTFLFISLYSCAIHTPGTLDPSFDSNGIVQTGIGADTIAYALVRQPDHKLVTAGQTTIGGFIDFALARYNPDGSLDITFGGPPLGPMPGTVITDVRATGNDIARALIIQSDGKLVAAGIEAGIDFALARYNTDGSLDVTFGGEPFGPRAGLVTTDFPGTSFDKAISLIIQPDNKLVAAGTDGASSGPKFALARYNPDGSLDLTFAATGKATTSFGGTKSEIHDLIIQSDGKLVAAGEATIGGNDLFALARYNTNGTLDATFGGSPFGPMPGTVTTSFGTGSDSIANALIIQPDGKLIVAGRTTTGGISNFALVRYNPDGTLDDTFGESGTGIVITGLDGTDSANALILQPDGKLVAAGTSDNSFALVRYNLDGSLDTTFNPNGPKPGTVITNINGIDIVHALAFQTDETQLKLVAAGQAGSSQALAQYFAVDNISPLANAVITKYCLN